jgi:MFS family permease
LSIKKFKVIYTIFVFIALAAFDNIIVGLFPPLFQSISKDLDVNVAKMGIVSALNILTTAISSVYWGYLSGKFKRKKLIIIGTLIWVLSVFLTAYSHSYFQLLFFQILTGIGLGCIASIGFSVLTDSIPYQYRGLILSLWGMTQGLGGIFGSLLASLVATSSTWRTPFVLVGFIGFFLIVLYLFVKEPARGESDPELQELIKEGSSYNYIIEAKHIFGILFKGSNMYLYLQAFFMNISTGSLIWLPTLYIYKIQQQGYSSKTAIIAAGYLYAIFQLGGMTSAYFGHLGDKLQTKTFKGRALLTAVFVFLTAPFYIAMFIIPMTNLSLPSDNNPFFILTDVNLPEHRGTAFSVANLSNSLGRTLGNVGVGLVLSMVSVHSKEPMSYIITLSLLQIFLIPSSICYVVMAKNNVRDIRNVKKTLNERANNN